MLNNLRIKFVRGEEVKYISHLDLMNVFERALRRARIPIHYSQGFNPHPHLVFGLPLSVGTTSETEYADFELAEYIEPSKFTSKLNDELPTGLKILETKEKHSKSNIMASISMAAYRILVVTGEKTGIELIATKIEEFKSKPSIIAKKQTKTGVKDIDIKPMIYKLDILKSNNIQQNELPINNNGYENIFYLNMLLSAGSVANLKPELLVMALVEELDLEVKFINVHRTGLFVNVEGRISDPMDIAVLKAL